MVDKRKDTPSSSKIMNLVPVLLGDFLDFKGL